MNLSLTTADAIILDMAQVDPETGFVRIELFAGDGQRFAAFFTITAGLNSLLLSDFTGLTDAVAADIDGIEFSGQAGGTSDALGNGHIFNKIAIGAADNIAPVINSVTPSTRTLWPPNHQMVPVSVTVDATDNVGVTSLEFISATSSEPDNGLGDGDTAYDTVLTGAMSLNLRAERSGKGNGRTYTITVEAKDAAGNATTRTVTVSVPKNQSGK